jgi:hypothetical protein
VSASLLAIVLLFASVHAGAASAAPSPDCQPLCRVTCLKPITIADKWDDETAITGYPEWQRNGFFDQEDYSDLNGNRLYDPSEPFSDDNGNGVFDAEFYDPMLTGYMASQDLGQQLEIKAAGPGVVAANAYFPLTLSVVPGEFGEVLYRWNWSNCHPTVYGIGDILQTEHGSLVGATQTAVLELYNLDPNAAWDPSCSCVKDSDFESSPRLFVVAARDPRIYLIPGAMVVHATKLMGLFLESMTANSFVVRLAEVTDANGDSCEGTEADGGFVFNCDPVQVRATTWGRIKAIHRQKL